MKTKKINLNWQSVLLGMALCLVLVVFIGGKAYSPQTPGQGGVVNAVTESDLLIKYTEMHKKIVAMDKDLTRIETKIDLLVDEVHQVLKIVRVLERKMER